MLSTRNLLIQLSILAALVAVYNLACIPLARGTLAAKTLRQVQATPAATRTIFVGSSVVVQGLDPNAFDAAEPVAAPSANIGMHSCTTAEQYQLLAVSLRRATQPTLIVWGFFGNELVAPVAFDFSNVIGTREMPFYADRAIGDPIIARQNGRDALTMRIVRPFPLLTERARLWARVEWLRRKLDVIGLPPPPENSMGREADLNGMADAEYQPAMTQEYLSGQLQLTPYVVMGIELAQRRSIPCVFVEMPLRSDQRKAVDMPERAAFRTKLAADLQTHGCRLIRCVDWIGDDARFEDHVHLDARGAAQFSEMLARDLRKE